MSNLYDRLARAAVDAIGSAALDAPLTEEGMVQALQHWVVTQPDVAPSIILEAMIENVARGTVESLRGSKIW